MQIEAHTGSVSHLAFSYPNKQLSVVTCGDDRIIKVCLSDYLCSIVALIVGDDLHELKINPKVWDAVTGEKRYTFEGHEAPVFSVCPHYKENIQVTSFVSFCCCCNLQLISYGCCDSFFCHDIKYPLK